MPTKKKKTATPKTEPLVLEPGKFYEAGDGGLWCCVFLDMNADEHAQATCVRIGSGHPEFGSARGKLRDEYFYRDGRYDRDGVREHNLIKEVPAGCAVFR